MLLKTRSMTAISESLHVELLRVAVGCSPPGHLVLWQITTRDLGATSAYARRVATMRGERPNILKGIDSLVIETTRFLKEQDRAPRRKPPSQEGPPQ